jgi:large subunit ribosomal protein L23
MSVRRDIHSILRRPVVTEKSTSQKEASNQVVFLVRHDANKIEIRAAVEKLLGVQVIGVNTLIGSRASSSASVGVRVSGRTGRRPSFLLLLVKKLSSSIV